MAAHPDLQAEQAYIDRAYDRLDAMRRAAEDLRDSVIDMQGGTPQARVERDVFVQTSLQRLEQLQLGRSALCFGRIDTDLEKFYVGRLAVSDEHQEPMVVDWRAPVAEAFYRATGRSPMGLRRRRHFATEGRHLLGIEDELFSADGTAEGDLELVGPGALLAALERSRSGHMRDIVATVQREQDEIIRAELPGVLVVQGGPGTGKTAVALHRAAYLLYTYRFPLESQGLLVIGPNQLFLRYIEQVLPSLGESGAILTTIGGLMPHIRPRHEDPPRTAKVKGDGRMARVLSKAVADRQRGLPSGLTLGWGRATLRLDAKETASIVHAAKRRGGTHNSRRRVVESMLLRSLHEKANAVLAIDHAEFVAQVRRDRAVVAGLDRMWPLLAPEDLLNDLFGAPALLALATDGVLSDDDRDALARPRAHSRDAAEWTPADIPLLDEAHALLGPVKRGRDDELRGYGHIVVDEAQDVSPMALRMLGRRSISGSMTLTGDIVQATSAYAPAGWDDVLRWLPVRRPPRITTLSVNYRTPSEIMDVAGSVLRATGVTGVTQPRSVRSSGRVPALGVPEDLAVVAATELDRVSPGTVAIIAATQDLASLRGALDGLPWGEPERTGLSAPITLLDVFDAKGLEFDSVIVVSPERLGGLRALYVALTRTTRRLTILHSGPLPRSLETGLKELVLEGQPLR